MKFVWLRPKLCTKERKKGFVSNPVLSIAFDVFTQCNTTQHKNDKTARWARTMTETGTVNVNAIECNGCGSVAQRGWEMISIKAMNATDSAEEKLQFAYKTNQASKQTNIALATSDASKCGACLYNISHNLWACVCVCLCIWNAQRTYRAVHIQIVCRVRVAGACIGCFKHSSHFHSQENASSLFIQTHGHVHKFITWKCTSTINGNFMFMFISKYQVVEVQPFIHLIQFLA